jgi:CBS-domain-containing membrane protein
MRIVNKAYSSLRRHFLVQTLAGAVAVMLLMLLASLIDSEVVVASIGASVFIAVTLPHGNTTRPRYLVGGYFCGILAGLAGFALHSLLPWFPIEVAGGLAVGLAMLLMVWLELEHPPAAALALGLVMSPHTLMAFAIAIGCIILLSACLHFCRPWMRNLL